MRPLAKSLPSLAAAVLAINCSSGPGPYAVQIPSPVSVRSVEAIQDQIKGRVKQMGYTLYEPEESLRRMREIGLEPRVDVSRFVYADKDLGGDLWCSLGCKRRQVLLVFLVCASACGSDSSAQQWGVEVHSLYFKRPGLLSSYTLKGSTKEGQADADALIRALGGVPEKLEKGL